MTIPRVTPVASKSIRTLHQRERTDPCTAVIMGAGGDLMKRKLMPAIYYLAAQHLLPEDFALVGVGREPMQHEDFAKSIRDALEHSDEVECADSVALDWLSKLIWYT